MSQDPGDECDADQAEPRMKAMISAWFSAALKPFAPRVYVERFMMPPARTPIVLWFTIGNERDNRGHDPGDEDGGPMIPRHFIAELAA